MLKCKKCNIPLNFNNYCKERDILNKVICCCKTCGSEIIKKMKNEMIVETYNNNDIYKVDGKYMPYWGCHYYFTTLEDVKKRIDARYIGIY